MKETEKKILFAGVASSVSLIFILYLGTIAIAVISSLIVGYVVYKLLSAKRGIQMLAYEVADEIGKYMKSYGMNLNLRRSNIQSQEVRSLKLLVEYFNDEGLVFYYDLKTHDIVGPKRFTLQEAVDEIYMMQNLFVSPTQVREIPEEVIETKEEA